MRLTVLEDGIAPITGRTVGGESFPTLTRRGDGTKRINVFYVWEWETDEPGTDTDAQADDIPGRNIIYEDRTGVDEGVLFRDALGGDILHEANRDGIIHDPGLVIDKLMRGAEHRRECRGVTGLL